MQPGDLARGCFILLTEGGGLTFAGDDVPGIQYWKGLVTVRLNPLEGNIPPILTLPGDLPLL